jgi:hypothetical protein
MRMNTSRETKHFQLFHSLTAHVCGESFDLWLLYMQFNVRTKK